MSETKYLATRPRASSASSEQGICRRDALKTIGLSPVVALSLMQTSATPAQASEAKDKIVIVGGGTSAIIVLSRLFRILSTPNITIIAPNETHLFQQGQILVAAGEYASEDIIKGNDNYIPEHVNWVKETVKRFDPDNNHVVTQKEKRISYDHLIIATGIIPYYERIKGLTAKDIGSNGIASIYLNDLENSTATGAEMANFWLDEIVKTARQKVPSVLFTQPSTPIKCESAPQQLLFLGADRLRHSDPTLHCDYVFATGKDALSPLSPIADALLATQKQYSTITNALSYELTAIDVTKKVATFSVEDGTDDQSQRHREVKRAYDFIHIVPPMGPPKAVADSSLTWKEGSQQGWLEVDKETLQHRRYKNVFGIGDVCGLTGNMTAASAHSQVNTLIANLIAFMEGNSITQRYDGHTFCPIKTEFGKSIAAEYDDNGIIAPLPFFKPLQPRWIWWATERYLHRPIYWQLILRGLA